MTNPYSDLPYAKNWLQNRFLTYQKYNISPDGCHRQPVIALTNKPAQICVAVVARCQIIVEVWKRVAWINFIGSGSPVDRAWAYLVLCWMGRNGAAGTKRINYQFTMRYTANGGDSATRWHQVVESIPAWHDRLAKVVISNRCGIKLAEKIDDVPGVAIYADPPYLSEGDAYAHTFADGGMFGDDHKRLAEILCDKKHCRIVVSYYDSPRLKELYPGWTKVDCTMQKMLAVQNKRGAVRSNAPEVLLINGPSFTTAELGAA